VRVRTVVAAEILLLVGLIILVLAAWLVERGFGLDQPLALGRPGAAVAAAAPGALWLAYVCSQERGDGAPKHHLIGTYLMAAFLAGPLTQFALDALLAPHPAAAPDLDPLSAARAIRAFLVVGVAQQLAVYAVVRYGVYRTSELAEPLDAVVYATAAGLGYAAYLTFADLRAAGGEAFLSVAAALTVVHALAQACFAAVLGYALGMAKFGSAARLRRALGLGAGLAIAVALDGQYLLVSGALATHGLEATPWRALAFGFGFAAAVFIVASLLIRRLVALKPRALERG
jgi:RsiW-degrading membrane proteinase PrsW (M82 family)